MKNLILFITTFIITLTSQTTLAAGFTLEPTYGVERSQREYPEPKSYRTKTFLGLRAIYGVWNVYRTHEKLDFFSSLYNFIFYAINALIKRIK